MKDLLKAKSDFRKKGVALIADKQKSGGGGSWKFISEDMFLKTIQKPLAECGLEYIATLEYRDELGVQVAKGTLFHIESGESISSEVSLGEITPKKDRNGNPLYLDAEIERGKQFGYWARILGIRLLGLSDIDPEDIDKAPTDISKEPKSYQEISDDLSDEKIDKEKALKLLRLRYAYTNDDDEKEQIQKLAGSLKNANKN